MSYGVCELPVIPARAKDNDPSEMVTQILFGECFQVLEEKEKWVRIVTAKDNYECWICMKQWKEITHEDYDNYTANAFPVCADFDTTVVNTVSDEEMHLTMGATLPYLHTGKFSIRNTKYTYNGTTLPANTDNIDAYALKLLNTPYLWGGRTPFGIDCSGYSKLIFQLCGIYIPRDAWQQAEEGELIDTPQKGDLAFFQNANGKINHVGIMIDTTKIIHASGKVRIDTLDEKGIYNEETKSHSHIFHSVRRYY